MKYIHCKNIYNDYFIIILQFIYIYIYIYIYIDLFDNFLFRFNLSYIKKYKKQ